MSSSSSSSSSRGRRRFWRRGQRPVPGTARRSTTSVSAAAVQVPPPKTSSSSSSRPAAAAAPSSSSSSSSAAPHAASAMQAASTTSNRTTNPNPSTSHTDTRRRALRQAKFTKLLDADACDMQQLRSMAWHGIPRAVRADTWQLLLGYLPVNHSRRTPTLAKRRAEYAQYLASHYHISATATRPDAEMKILNQIKVDVPRTCPGQAFFQQKKIQDSLERVLFVWAVRHPASGYVQGINDLATPFYEIFLCRELELHHGTHETDEKSLLSGVDASDITEEQFATIEADCFGCMSKLLDGIQDHYTFAQPGIQRMIFHLQELVERIDASLTKHFADQGLQFIQFAFRWMNCLLMRELRMPLVIRLWDTYLAEENANGFKAFHIYVCAAFLMTWCKQLKTLEFQDLVIYLQHLPTEQWAYRDIEMILAQAHVYKTLYHGAQAHLK